MQKLHLQYQEVLFLKEVVLPLFFFFLLLQVFFNKNLILLAQCHWFQPKINFVLFQDGYHSTISTVAQTSEEEVGLMVIYLKNGEN